MECEQHVNNKCQTHRYLQGNRAGKAWPLLLHKWSTLTPNPWRRRGRRRGKKHPWRADLSRPVRISSEPRRASLPLSLSYPGGSTASPPAERSYRPLGVSPELAASKKPLFDQSWWCRGVGFIWSQQQQRKKKKKKRQLRWRKCFYF